MGDHRKQICGVLLFVIGITFVFGQLCGNCLSQCNDITGLCSGNCTLGWDGPTCSRRNVAFNQKTTQSSDYSESGFTFVSSLAVDGRTGHVFYNKPYTCSHTGGNPLPASWTVTLDAQYNIYRFRIYNRTCGGECGTRLNGFTLSVGNSSQNYKICYQDTTTAPTSRGEIIDGVCNSGSVFGDTVKIMITNSPILILCEVQIFVCTPGTYGTDCENTCGNCADGASACNTISGFCPQKIPRCRPGYVGEKCDTVCAPGTYGTDCEKTCGNCTEGPSVCNLTTGHCPLRTPKCMEGYSGLKCDTVCVPGRYGPDCEKKCRNCTEGPYVCNSTTGYCPLRTPNCMAGYSGLKCDTDKCYTGNNVDGKS